MNRYTGPIFAIGLVLVLCWARVIWALGWGR
jgi:hypothetical protein